MKIFKMKNLLEAQESQENGIQVRPNETVICKSDKEGRNFVIYQRILQTESYLTEVGSTMNLKAAISLAETMEKPTMDFDGYTIIPFATGQALILYYEQYEDVILEAYKGRYDINTNRMEIGKGTPAHQSGVFARYALEVPQDKSDENRVAMEQLLVQFGNYMMSEQRHKRFRNHPVMGDDRLQERLSEVNHADIANFFDAGSSAQYTPYMGEPLPMGEAERQAGEALQSKIDALNKVEQMCGSSLPPELSDQWETICNTLIDNTEGMIPEDIN